MAQKKNSANTLDIYPTTQMVHIDGMADDSVWKYATVARDFYMVLPMDTSHARVKTEVQMTFDKNNLYLLATCYKALPGRDMVESLRRDFSYPFYFNRRFKEIYSSFTCGV